MKSLMFGGILVLCAATAFAAPIIDPFFAGSYSLTNLGAAGTTPGPYGGLTLKDGDVNTLLLGGNANNANGAIFQNSLTRDGSGHITGFTGPTTQLSTAPNIDGGLEYGPGGVLFYTAYPTNGLGEIKPGSAAPDKTVNLGTTTQPVPSSTGALAFIPSGFAGAGQMAIVSYNANTFQRATLAADGSGTYNVSSVTASVPITGGAEGILYVPLGSALFASPTILISEYSAGLVSAYTLDVNGDPILASRKTFISGLSGAEGAALDPVTNDFLFSTFSSGNQVFRVSGFAAPPSDVPEPATFAFVAGGLLAAGLLKRKR
jgi:hypothetical protein